MASKEQVDELHKMILQGQLLDAFEKFYAENVVMQENAEEPRVGKEANREYEKQFVENIQEAHSVEMKGVAFSEDGNVVMSEWYFDVTFKDGTRMKKPQISVQNWEGGQIVKERFFSYQLE